MFAGPNPAQVELRIPGVQEEPEFSQSHFSCRQVVFRLNQGRCSDVFLGKRGIPAKQEALLISMAAAMSSSDGTNETSDAVRRRRRRSNSLLLVLAVGFLVFGAAAGALYYVVAINLRIAVGPPGSEDHKVVQAMAEAFASESRTVRLSPTTTHGAVEALALLGAGRPDLAVGSKTTLAEEKHRRIAAKSNRNVRGRQRRGIPASAGVDERGSSDTPREAAGCANWRLLCEWWVRARLHDSHDRRPKQDG